MVNEEAPSVTTTPAAIIDQRPLRVSGKIRAFILIQK
jgi:hypothetical protein